MWNGIKTSVAMATYNGAEYIVEQLNSIFTQTVLPDEIVISDDGSSDNTIAVIHQYLEGRERKAVSVILLEDNPNHGIPGNFTYAINHCSGDVIFICGQDDIWLKHKVEAYLQTFSQHPEALMVIAKYQTIDSSGKMCEASGNSFLMNSFKQNKENIIQVDRSRYLGYAASTNLISGTVMAISKELKKALPVRGSAEDQWLGFTAVAEDRCYFINETFTCDLPDSE